MADISSSTNDEIEVTPEMVDAGSEALMPFYMGDGAYDLREPALIAVYRAMRETDAKAGWPARTPSTKRERADGPRFGKVEKRAVGPNDFGAPEDEVMDIITPFRVPEGIVFRDARSGELTDSAGKSVPSPI